eukprot:TRINITY_DN24152_c0_g1_i1.p1 TRINITY_DN24152_c0_g1~~TRINITY_DN24152_c0_g1_i1.p1  ORF type:complete len:623 (+),score=114.33 TRINITY_DN24152_c0_g1_i1:116-1984(+)
MPVPVRVSRGSATHRGSVRNSKLRLTQGLVSEVNRPSQAAAPLEFGASAELPSLSVCRLEAREDLLRKLRQHVDDPDLADFICPICWEPFWQPVRTVCGHAFCEGCLLKSVLAQLGHQQPDVSCPLCRHPLHVNDVSADQALLTRIRVVLTQKSREEEGQPRRANGRLCKGLVRATTPVQGVSSSSSSSSSAGGPVAPSPSPVPGSRPGTSLGMADPEALRSLAVTPVPAGRPPSSTSQAQVMRRDSEDADMCPVPLLSGWIRVAPSVPRMHERRAPGSNAQPGGAAGPPPTRSGRSVRQATAPGGPRPLLPSQLTHAVRPAGTAFGKTRCGTAGDVPAKASNIRGNQGLTQQQIGSSGKAACDAIQMTPPAAGLELVLDSRGPQASPSLQSARRGWSPANQLTEVSTPALRNRPARCAQVGSPAWVETEEQSHLQQLMVQCHDGRRSDILANGADPFQLSASYAAGSSEGDSILPMGTSFSAFVGGELPEVWSSASQPPSLPMSSPGKSQSTRRCHNNDFRSSSKVLSRGHVESAINEAADIKGSPNSADLASQFLRHQPDPPGTPAARASTAVATQRKAGCPGNGGTARADTAAGSRNYDADFDFADRYWKLLEDSDMAL